MGHGQKSGHGRKNVAHGKNGKMLKMIALIYFIVSEINIFIKFR